MIESIERELKYLVARNEFYALKQYLDSCSFPNSTVIQTNYYFDTSNYDLKRKGTTLRLREINNKEYYFTAKLKNAEIINNLHNKKEFDMEIDEKLFNLVKSTKDISKQLDVLKPIINVIGHEYNGPAVGMIGCLTTERTAYEIPGFTKPILLDKNMYLNETDYEIEWETEQIDSAMQKIKSIFDDLGIVAQASSISKSKRFILTVMREAQKINE